MLTVQYNGEGACSTHCTGCWVSPRVALYAVEKGTYYPAAKSTMIPLSSICILVTMLTYPGCSQNCVYDEIEIVDYSYGMFTTIHVRFFLCYSLLFKSIKL